MQPLAKLPLRDLLRRKEAVEQALGVAQPALWQELILLNTLISNFDSSDQEKPYAQVKWPKTAIPMCLERNQAWMTRAQIQRDLESGGFVFESETFPNLLADALRYHHSRGTLARRDEHGNIIKPGSIKPGSRNPNERWGLPEWVKNPKIGELKEISK